MTIATFQTPNKEVLRWGVIVDVTDTFRGRNKRETLALKVTASSRKEAESKTIETLQSGFLKDIEVVSCIKQV